MMRLSLEKNNYMVRVGAMKQNLLLLVVSFTIFVSACNPAATAQRATGLIQSGPHRANKGISPGIAGARDT